MRSYLFIFLLFFFPIISNAQLNSAVKKASDDNQKKHEEVNNSNNSVSGSSDENSNSSSETTESSSDSNTAGVEAGFFLFKIVYYLFSGIGTAIIDGDSIIRSDTTIHRINSASFALDAGFTHVKNSVFVPKIQLNGALFSTQARYFALKEKMSEQKSDYFTTFDWQILMFNLAVLKNFNLRIGTGFMNENYSGQYFWEHSAAIDIYPNNKFNISMEGRIAPDYTTHIFARSEFDVSAGYVVKKWNSTNLRLSLGYNFRQFYESVNFNTVHLSLAIEFE